MLSSFENMERDFNFVTKNTTIIQQTNLTMKKLISFISENKKRIIYSLLILIAIYFLISVINDWSAVKESFISGWNATE
ncbi:MAG: hypothetical protein LKI53_04885 [Bacteroidales bacterium]|jgi:hypothetical protein|nr:hypothetical protein [Bacteroidales bacterium]